MHDADEKIIALLRDDSRRDDATMAKIIDIPESEVHQRIERMISDDIISRFTIEAGDARTRAIVLVSVDSTAESSQVSEKLASLEGIDTVYEITGQHDIATIIASNNIAAINSTIDALRSIDGVTDTNTMIILRKVRAAK